MRLVVVSSNTFAGNRIKKVTGTKWTHGGVLGRGFRTIESDWGGIRTRNLWEYPWEYEVIEYASDPELDRTALRWAYKMYRDQFGYDHLQIFGIWLEITFGWYGAADLLDSDKLFTCSEFMARFSSMCNVEPPSPGDKSRIRPDHFGTDPRPLRVTRTVQEEMRYAGHTLRI